MPPLIPYQIYLAGQQLVTHLVARIDTNKTIQHLSAPVQGSLPASIAVGKDTAEAFDCLLAAEKSGKGFDYRKG